MSLQLSFGVQDPRLPHLKEQIPWSQLAGFKPRSSCLQKQKTGAKKSRVLSWCLEA